MDTARSTVCRNSRTGANESKMVAIDFKTICRICGKSEETLTSVHSRYQSDLRGKIAKHLSIDIAENDRLPTKICFCCKDIITKWHDLFEKCRSMEQRFITVLKSCEEVQHEATVSAAEPTEAEKPSTPESVAEESDTPEKNTSTPEKSLSQSEQPDAKKSKKTPLRPKPVDCTFCKSDPTARVHRFASQTVLVDHMKDQHWDQIFHCEQCDNYLDRAKLIEHMTMHALSLVLPVPSGGSEPEGGASADSGSAAGDEEPDGELEEAEGSQQTTELKSGEGSTNKENDEKEEVTVGELKGLDSRKLYCYICEKTLANRSAYSYHVNQVHLNIKNFDCSFCEKKFGNRRLLNNHIANVHSRERNFSCNVCAKRFKTNVALYNHSRVHDDKLQFSCRFCDKKFRFRNHLVSHELIHLDERSFSCGQCSKKFNTNECLQKHKLTHVTTEPYQCPLCGFSTKQKRYLVMHAKRIHMVR
ncbi:zinc finger protein OZF-like [Anopheles cruzii]|uniref:zinc finger protein OZF-like n=1 Tax=Anopheles cruzii TaxID=68878 RepID=UPI0022EC1A54|nr:zinc finger protein OZF-like [Anopheles cruzii]